MERIISIETHAFRQVMPELSLYSDNIQWKQYAMETVAVTRLNPGRHWVYNTNAGNPGISRMPKGMGK